MLAADVRDKIQLYIVSHFESSDYIYYDAILDKFSKISLILKSLTRKH